MEISIPENEKRRSIIRQALIDSNDSLTKEVLKLHRMLDDAQEEIGRLSCMLSSRDE